MTEDLVKAKDPDFQLRRDVVSGTWVVFSTKRKNKIIFHRDGQKVSAEYDNVADCPFCREDFSDQEEDTLIYTDKNGNWSLRVFPNKFPILSPKIKDLNKREKGPFEVMDGLGYHEILITKDHRKNFPDLETLEIAEILDAYQERYLALMNKKEIKFISIFTNYGKTAGASLIHPHSQIVAMPVIDPDVVRSIDGSMKYFRAHKKCVHCLMIEWELEERERVVFENEDFVIICPFVSRVAFETRIYPKRHLSYFERITDGQKVKLAEAIKWISKKMKDNLDDSDYNMFLHTAPCDGQIYDHYHWHFEVFPKTNIWAGLELSTGIEVCSILPEEAAKVIKN